MTIHKREDGMYQVLKSDTMYCKHCGENVEWNRFFDSYYCADCRMDDVYDRSEEEEQLNETEGDLDA